MFNNIQKENFHIADGIATPIYSIESEYGLGRDPSHSASNETFCRCHNRGRICYCDTRQGSNNAELFVSTMRLKKAKKYMK